MSRNCPDKSSARSRAPGKPPGLQLNSIRLDLQELDALRDEAKNDGEETNIFLGMMEVNPEDAEDTEDAETESAASEFYDMPELQSVTDSDVDDLDYPDNESTTAVIDAGIQSLGIHEYADDRVRYFPTLMVPDGDGENMLPEWGTDP
ncbi:hypothetical protein H0H92_015593, partial [Tricholoma furcatifolium]